MCSKRSNTRRDTVAPNPFYTINKSKELYFIGMSTNSVKLVEFRSGIKVELENLQHCMFAHIKCVIRGFIV